MSSAKSPSASHIIISAPDLTKRPPESFPAPAIGEPSKGEVTWHTLFSSPATPSDSLCAGVAVCPPLTGHLCAHRHTQAEVYYITEGQGIVTIDGKDSRVEKGDAVFIAGDAEHGIRNDGEEELKWFYIFPTASFSDVVYRFS
ncbi:Dimethlysulfonioproprionate lyase [Lachnellula subtilissima]|uniref:Dimethlysulfonioproprionate lyase n=1 Tax=Lachnellula subtilissima TaxID=602034 RepID=A0A8H8RJY5_9HELO|nr:Dimethlysulfonioproprionate lyase [Lachnellula subtilissima]